jgi:pyridoxamine 5'-phosphate oxidase
MTDAVADPYADALATFGRLLQEAVESGDPEPTAMTAATVDERGMPSARTVLLKAWDARGFVFYTNYDSRKGAHLAANPRAALLFHWKTIRDGVQVRIEGTVEPVTLAEADAYFATRPRPSQIGSWASLQSRTLPSRDVFDARFDAFEKKFASGEVPRPPNWSGYRVVPELIEFWYGQRFRLHDRVQVERVDGAWTQRLLYP